MTQAQEATWRALLLEELSVRSEKLDLKALIKTTIAMELTQSTYHEPETYHGKKINNKCTCVYIFI